MRCTRKVEAIIPVNVAASRYTVNVNPQIHAHGCFVLRSRSVHHTRCTKQHDSAPQETPQSRGRPRELRKFTQPRSTTMASRRDTLRPLHDIGRPKRPKHQAKKIQIATCSDQYGCALDVSGAFSNISSMREISRGRPRRPNIKQTRMRDKANQAWKKRSPAPDAKFLPSLGLLNFRDRASQPPCPAGDKRNRAGASGHRKRHCNSVSQSGTPGSTSRMHGPTSTRPRLQN